MSRCTRRSRPATSAHPSPGTSIDRLLPAARRRLALAAVDDSITAALLISDLPYISQVPDVGAVDPEGGGVPDHQRRADAGREPAAEPGVLRHHVDGARVRQAHPGLHQQELRRHGRVPRHHRAPGIVSISLPVCLLLGPVRADISDRDLARTGNRTGAST